MTIKSLTVQKHYSGRVRAHPFLSVGFSHMEPEAVADKPCHQGCERNFAASTFGKDVCVLKDRFERTFPYLRLSITDVCNFRCTYCLPNGYSKTETHFLTPDEILRLVRGFSTIGTHKIRLTGGEPTLRRDLAVIAQSIALVPGIQTLALTTNGYRLREQAQLYFDSGISALNVSVDNLDPHAFRNITGRNTLSRILEGIKVAQSVGFTNIKVNSVLLKGYRDTVSDFLDWIQENPITIRFIELMQTGTNFEYFKTHHLSATTVEQLLLERGFTELERKSDAGPAREFHHPEYKGRIGLIAPYSKDFCLGCNRLRVTSSGELMLCLFGSQGYNLRPFLQCDSQLDALENAISAYLQLKEEGHQLHAGLTGKNLQFSSIGG